LHIDPLLEKANLSKSAGYDGRWSWFPQQRDHSLSFKAFPIHTPSPVSITHRRPGSEPCLMRTSLLYYRMRQTVTGLMVLIILIVITFAFYVQGKRYEDTQRRIVELSASNQRLQKEIEVLEKRLHAVSVSAYRRLSNGVLILDWIEKQRSFSYPNETCEAEE
jgi:hypothetical protein